MTASHKRATSSRAAIDRDLPHQVALPNDMCTQENYWPLHNFCDSLGVRWSTRHVIAQWADGVEREYRLYCFATPEAAGRFAKRFEGTPFDPKRDREKGGTKGAWHRTDASAMPERCGPLKMPKFFIEHP